MKKRYFIYFSYDGSAYVGWQIQPNGLSVQEVMQKVFSTVLRDEIEIVAAGRTDSGVHAKCMIAHADIDFKSYSLPDFINKINSFLPNDIAISNIVEVKADAHARFDAVSRKYEYHLVAGKNVFLSDYAMRVFHPLDFEAMNRAAETLFDYTDFTSFSKLHTDVKTNNCRISEAYWVRDDATHFTFTITADRFLRNMVRAIVGTLLEAGRGKLDERGLRRIIEAKNRSVAGDSAPGHALFLHDVVYPEDIWVTK